MQLGKVREAIAKIMELRREQEKGFRELLVWADAHDQGIDPATVDRWGWDHALIRPRLWGDAKEAALVMEAGGTISHPRRNLLLPWVGAWLVAGGKAAWFNYVILKDGTKRVLEPFIQAAEGRVLP